MASGPNFNVVIVRSCLLFKFGHCEEVASQNKNAIAGSGLQDIIDLTDE